MPKVGVWRSLRRAFSGVKTRVLLVAILLIASGSFLLLAPIFAISPVARSVPSGGWIDLFVPATTAFLGGPVTVYVTWGPADPCPRYGPACEVQPRSTLLVLDCGTAPCGATGGYDSVGKGFAQSQSTVNFPAESDHHYQIWGWWGSSPFPPNSTSNDSIPLSFLLEGPLSGGIPGCVGLVAGLGLLLYAIRPAFHRPSPSERLAEY
jgi:hypothetical protein